MIELRKTLRAEIWGTDMDRYVLRHPIIEIDGVLVDVKAFFQTRAGCDLCGRCCAHGANVPEEIALKLEPHLSEIAERYIPAERRNEVGWAFSHAWDLKYTNISRIDSHTKACSFLYKSGDQYLCSIYSWALDTKRDPSDFWPFECFMYPMAIVPYDGILHPGKLLLTLRLPQNWHLIEFYGPGRALNRSLLRKILYELKNALVGRLQALGLAKTRPEDKGDCYFAVSSQQKVPSFRYFEKQISKQFGSEFYEKLSSAAGVYHHDTNMAQQAGGGA